MRITMLFRVIGKIIIIVFLFISLNGCTNSKNIESKMINNFCSNFYNSFNNYSTSLSIINNLQPNIGMGDIKNEMYNLGLQEKATTQMIYNFLQTNSKNLNIVYKTKYNTDLINKNYNTAMAKISSNLALLDTLNVYDQNNFAQHIKEIIPVFIKTLPSPFQIMQIMLPNQFLVNLKQFASCSYLYNTN